MNSSEKVKSAKLSTAEAKLLILFLYYGITNFVLICGFSVYLRTYENILNTFMDYVICSAGGDKAECHVIRDRLYDAVTAPLIMDWIVSTLVLFLSIVNLNFVIQYSDIKKAISYLLHSLKVL